MTGLPLVHRPSPRGFTLLEVIIVMAIIIVLAVAAVPNLAGSARHMPLLDLTDEVMAKFEYAKVRAVNDFRATGVEVLSTESGRLSVHRSNSPSCNGIDWAQDAAIGEVIDLDARWDPSGGEGSAADANLQIVQLLPAGVTRICFTPDGRMVNAEDGQIITNVQTDGALVVGIRRFADDGLRRDGPMHFIIVPFSGKPHWLYSFDDDFGTAEGRGSY